jgi:hypothetical protein
LPQLYKKWEQKMDLEWLKGRDSDFHKRLYRLYCAQLVAVRKISPGHGKLIEEKMQALLSFQKITPNEATNIETEVRVELAETNLGLEASRARLYESSAALDSLCASMTRTA